MNLPFKVKLKVILLTLLNMHLSNISNVQTLLPKETVNQNATKHALLADETATTSAEEYAASPPKVSKVKKIPTKGKKLHQNWLLIRMP